MICLYGQAGVGKTALLLKYAHGVFWLSYDPTVEDLHQIDLPAHDPLYWIRDIGGTTDFFEDSVGTSTGFLLVYAINDESVRKIESILCTIRERRQDKPPILIVANKYDLQREVVSIAAIKEGEMLAQKFDCGWAIISTKNEDVTPVFEKMAKLISAFESRKKTKETKETQSACETEEKFPRTGKFRTYWSRR